MIATEGLRGSVAVGSRKREMRTDVCKPVLQDPNPTLGVSLRVQQVTRAGAGSVIHSRAGAGTAAESFRWVASCKRALSLVAGVDSRPQTLPPQ